jgi:spore germination protein
MIPIDKYRELITHVQLATIIISSMIGVTLLALPRLVVRNAGLGAPFASVVGVTIGFIGLLAVVLLGRRFPKKTIIGYNEIILGKPIGRLFSVLIILFFALLMGLEARHFSEVVAGSLLPNTPIQVAIFLMIFLCATTGFQSVSTFAYIHFFYIPLIMFPIVMVLIPSLRDIEIYHLTPILGNNPTFKEFMRGGLVATKGVIDFFVISMVIPFMINPNKCVKSGIWGYWIGSFFVIFIITMTLGVFGEEEIQRMFWPTLILGRMIHVPAEILARIDSILLISWIYGVFTTLLSYYFVFVRGTGELFRFYNYRVISLIGFPIMFIIAMFPQDIYEMYDFIFYVTFYGIFLIVCYPAFLLIVAILRKKGGTST